MYTNVLKAIAEHKYKVVIFDIDGTLKDLCDEHSKALFNTLEKMNVGNILRSLVKAINEFAMTIIKMGILPTNHNMQKILVFLYALVALQNVKCFRKMYFEEYQKQLKMFSGTKEMLNNLNSNLELYFVTVNEQNYNIKVCGISQDRIMHKKSIYKIKTYKSFLKNLNVKKSEILIVGDNLFDDLFSAKILGIDCVLVNNYNSKFKKLICKTVRVGS